MTELAPLFDASELSTQPDRILSAISRDELVNLVVSNYMEQAAIAEAPLRVEVQQAVEALQQCVLAFYTRAAEQAQGPIQAAADRIEKAFTDSGIQARADLLTLKRALLEGAVANGYQLHSSSTYREYTHGRTPLVDVVSAHLARWKEGPQAVRWEAALDFQRPDGSKMFQVTVPVDLVLEAPPECRALARRWEELNQKLSRLAAIQSEKNTKMLERKALAELTRRALANKGLAVEMPSIEGLQCRV